jgi:hypothetical protein
MTAYEQIREQFNESAVCKRGQRPRLDYEPGCLYVECAKAAECRCRLNSGEGGPVSAFLIEWRKRFAAG